MAELDAFQQGPVARSSRPWRRHGGGCWFKVNPFFAFHAHFRQAIRWANTIKGANARPRKIMATLGHSPTEDAATKLFWLALKNIKGDWDRAKR